MASNLLAMASNLLAMASSLRAMASNLLAMASNLLAMASNLLAMASSLRAMASNLLAMASSLRAMAFWVDCFGLNVLRYDTLGSRTVRVLSPDAQGFFFRNPGGLGRRDIKKRRGWKISSTNSQVKWVNIRVASPFDRNEHPSIGIFFESSTFPGTLSKVGFLSHTPSLDRDVGSGTTRYDHELRH